MRKSEWSRLARSYSMWRKVVKNNNRKLSWIQTVEGTEGQAEKMAQAWGSKCISCEPNAEGSKSQNSGCKHTALATG